MKNLFKALTLTMFMFLSSFVFAVNSDSTSNVINAPMSSDGYQVGSSASDKVGFFGATPVAQQSDASQVSFTDNSPGTVSDSIASTVGIETIAIQVDLAQISAAGDVFSAYVPGYRFKILDFAYMANVPASTAAKAATLNLEIDAVNVTGGEIALTSANASPLGAKVSGSAITASQIGAAGSSISVEAASVTAFAEGSGTLLIRIQNMDSADAFSSLGDKVNEILSSLSNLGLLKGSE